MESVNMKGQGNVMKVIELGLEDSVYTAMKKPNFSVESLTRQLRGEGINITSQSIRKFIRKTKDAQRELISRDIQTAEQFKQLTMDYGTKLKEILTEVEEIKNTAKDIKDLATVNQMIGRLFQGIELIAKLTGDIKPKGAVDINIIYNEINSNIDKDMKGIRSEIFTDKIIDADFDIVVEDKEVADRIKTR